MGNFEIGPRASAILEAMRRHRQREDEQIAASLEAQGLEVTPSTIHAARMEHLEQQDAWRREGLPIELDVSGGFDL